MAKIKKRNDFLKIPIGAFLQRLVTLALERISISVNRKMKATTVELFLLQVWS